MAEATITEFSHIMQPPLKPSSSQVDIKQVSCQFNSYFFTKVGSQMVVSGELNNGREARGRMVGKGFMKNVRQR